MLASRQEDQFRVLQTSIIAKLTEAIRDQVSLLPRPPTFGQETQQKIRLQEIAARASRPSRYKRPEKSALRTAENSGNPQSSRDQESFAEEYAQEYAARIAELEEEQWESLSFPVMYDREDQIASADLSTFDWIFEKPRSNDRPWSNFLEWLQKGGSLYWVNGKAGSGKSTLLKFLSTHQKTSDALQAWSGETPLVTASFFFWYNGNDLQRSQVGLLRALLYQALKNHRELVPFVLSEAAAVAPPDLPDFWTLTRLKVAFIKLLDQEDVPLKICLFVDGLDEYAGDITEISELFQELSGFKHIKLCISSRPLLPFDRAFQSFPGLVLQNLTFDDIQTYVQNRFNTDKRFEEFENEEPGLARKLAAEVVSKASGVFLWVKLVVHSLLEGLGNYDRSIDLQRRLSELPEDLNDLYWHILDRVKPAWYLEEGFKLLRLVYTAVVPLNLLQLAFTDLEHSKLIDGPMIQDMTLERQQIICRSMSGRIKSRCLGLLEVTDVGYKDEKYRRVQFLHKSVRDFMNTPRMRARIQDCLTGKDIELPEIAIMKSLLMQLRTLHSRLLPRQCSSSDKLTREAWFDEVRPIVVEILQYGQMSASKYRGMESVYNPLITQVEDVASKLWQSVSFREKGEVVHWTVAPRKPGAAVKGEIILPAVVETSGSQVEPDHEYGELYAIKSQTLDPLVNSHSPITGILKVRFAGLPEPQCYPNDDLEDERPQRSWRLALPTKLHSNPPFRAPMSRTDIENGSFETFVRAFGLNHYADERYNGGTASKGLNTSRDDQLRYSNGLSDYPPVEYAYPLKLETPSRHSQTMNEITNRHKLDNELDRGRQSQSPEPERKSFWHRLSLRARNKDPQ